MSDTFFSTPIPIPPTPTVRDAQVYLPDLRAAVARAQNAVLTEQMRDALRSVRVFLELAETALEQKAPKR
jgi:hypothetical protein